MTAAPQALIAEVTHRCPLHCVYCSNPEQMQSAVHELSTEDWTKIIEQAAEIGCWHLHLTGGEPLLRRDAEQLVLAGQKSGLYVNLITSGLGLTRERLGALVEAGLDHIQLSFQDSEEAEANTIAGTRAHAKKLQLAEWIRAHRIAFTVNLVIHRRNIDRLEELIRFAEGLKADKLEIANVQLLRLGAKKSSGSSAVPRTASGVTPGNRIGPSTAVWQDAYRLRFTRLLREVSEALHGRLGPRVDAD